MMSADRWMDDMRMRSAAKAKGWTGRAWALCLTLALGVSGLIPSYADTAPPADATAPADTAPPSDAAAPAIVDPGVGADSDMVKLGAAVAANPVPRPQHSRASLDGRVHTLSQALNLDATQQSKLRMLLVSQREQVGRLWNDTAVPPAYRVSATRAISEQTADRIRALLNEEQRKKFNPPRRPREAADAATPSVEDWMNKASAQ